MLWALLISLILHKQFGKSNKFADLPVVLEHTPGFYELEAWRLSKFPLALECKLLSAIKKYDTAKQRMSKFNNQGYSVAKTNAFFKLHHADNKITKSRQKLTEALDDAKLALQESQDINQVPSTAYKLAYSSKMEILKHELFRSRSK